MYVQGPITIVTGGSRGDVQPLVAIGRGLLSAGHRIRLAGHRGFAGLADTFGMEFFDLESGDPRETREAILSSGTGRWQTAKQFLRPRPGPDAAARGRLLDACRGSSALLITSISGTACHVGEALGIPVFYAVLHPIFPTREFASPFTPAMLAKAPPVRALNLASHHAIERLHGLLDRKWLDAWRLELGIPEMRNGPYLRTGKNRVLFGFSPSVVPRPADWPADLAVTGYWFLDAEDVWSPPTDLAQFLDAGPPPIFVGFGSTVDARPRELEQIVLSAVRATGRRAIIGKAPTTFKESRSDSIVFFLQEAPYSWLFPRVSMAVHHAGAGTCAEVIRAGIPSVVVPFFAEQRFWASRLAALGVAAEPIPRTRLDATGLREAIERVEADPEMRRASKALARRVATENGVSRAVEIVLSAMSS